MLTCEIIKDFNLEADGYLADELLCGAHASLLMSGLAVCEDCFKVCIQEDPEHYRKLPIERLS